MRPTWTILIPTLGQRADQFRALLDRLLPQTEPYAGRVRILAAFNNGTPPLPELRQRLVEAVDTDYLSFVDDDDMVSPDFVSSIMHSLEVEDVDYVGFQVGYYADGRYRGSIDHSLHHGGWSEQKNPYRWLRDITHINPIRTSVAKLADFRVVSGGQVEDRPWVQQIRTSGHLRTQSYIPREVYEYRWSRRGSAWQKPERIQQGHERPEISHPNFAWLPVNEPAAGRLAVIVPTRGRPDNIRKVIAAWDETQAWECADLILATDADDPELAGYNQIQGSDSRVRVMRQTTWLPMVAKLNAAARRVAEEGRHSAIAFAGDDHLPRTKHWAAMYLAALDQIGTGMVYGDDGYQGAKLSTEWAVTADAVRALGRMVPAPVDHLYCDNAMMDLFGGAGALRHLPEVRIEHMHPAAGKAKSDAQYDRVNGREQYSADQGRYQIWKTPGQIGGLTEQIEIIRRLRGDRPVVQPVPKRVERVPPMRGSRSNPRRLERSAPSVLNAAPRSQFPFPREFREIRGATPDEIAFTLADFAKAVPADQEIVELGVFQARTAVIMAWGASLGNGAHVTAIDPWELTGNVYDPPFTSASTRGMAEYNIERLGYGDKVKLRHAFSEFIADSWTEDAPFVQVGLLFVDGDHTKGGARRDIEAWAPHLAPGAVIAVDDYGHPDWPGVAQAVDELVDEGFLAPIELFHDRLAVTKLGRQAKISHRSSDDGGDGQAWAPITAITSEGIEPEPVMERTDSADGTVITVNGEVAYAALSASEPLDLNEFPPLRPIEDIEIPDVPQETLGSVRKRARALGLKPVGGIDDVLKQIADHEAL